MKTSLRRGGGGREGGTEITEDGTKGWWRVRDGKRMMKWKRKSREEGWKEMEEGWKGGMKMVSELQGEGDVEGRSGGGMGTGWMDGSIERRNQEVVTMDWTVGMKSERGLEDD